VSFVRPVSCLKFVEIPSRLAAAILAELRHPYPQLSNQLGPGYAARLRMFLIVIAFHDFAFFGAMP
jgi:hypothetical protein